MEFPIDKIFNSMSYRYVPIDIRKEWITLGEYYSQDYYNNMRKANYYNPQIKIDLYNEEQERLQNALNRVISFEGKIKDINGLTNGDNKYNKEMKDELSKSLKLMKQFIKSKQNILNGKLNKEDIPTKQKITETFKNAKNIINIEKKNINPLIISIIIVALFFLMTSKN